MEGGDISTLVHEMREVERLSSHSSVWAPVPNNCEKVWRAHECVRLTAVRRFLLFVFQHESVRLTAVRRFLLFVLQHASVCV